MRDVLCPDRHYECPVDGQGPKHLELDAWEGQRPFTASDAGVKER